LKGAEFLFLMKLGSLELKTDLLMAPMMDVTFPPVQELCRHYGGVGIIVTPMIFVNQIHRAPKTVKPLLEYVEKQRPVGVQIVASGRDKDALASTIDILNSYKFDFVDINAGCPARHTCGSGGGCNLIRTIEDGRLQTIVEYAVKHSDKPVSVKTRLGWSSAENCVEIAKKIESWNPEFLTIHGRIGIQGYTGSVDYVSIKKIKESLRIPVVGNGDVVDIPSFQKMKETGVDAVMIGRALTHNPKIFSIIQEFETTGKIQEYQPSIPLVREYVEFLENYVNGMPVYWNNPRFKTGLFKTTTIGFIKGIPNYKRMRIKISMMKSYEEILSFVRSTEIDAMVESSQVNEEKQTENESEDEREDLESGLGSCNDF